MDEAHKLRNIYKNDGAKTAKNSVAHCPAEKNTAFRHAATKQYS